MDWAGRFAYLSAKIEERQVDLYAYDLIWLIAKHYYTGLEQPSEIAYTRKKKDRRTSKQIIADVIKGLGGE